MSIHNKWPIYENVSWSGSKWSFNLLFQLSRQNVLRDLIAYSHIYVISYFGCVPRYNKFGLLLYISSKTSSYSFFLVLKGIAMFSWESRRMQWLFVNKKKTEGKSQEALRALVRDITCWGWKSAWYVCCQAEMEKRADSADISVLFFSLVVLIFWLYTRKLAKTAVLLALC